MLPCRFVEYRTRCTSWRRWEITDFGLAKLRIQFGNTSLGASTGSSGVVESLKRQSTALFAVMGHPLDVESIRHHGRVIELEVTVKTINPRSG